MTPDEYQQFTRTTVVYNNGSIPPLAYLGLKLAGEAGEIAEKIGKLFRDHGGVLTDEVRTALIKELGDPLWYIAQIADVMGFSLQDVIDTNVAKLQARQLMGTLHGSGDDR